jgi:hypothetical protein
MTIGGHSDEESAFATNYLLDPVPPPALHAPTRLAGRLPLISAADNIVFMAIDTGISTLLDLHGQIIDQEDGYWVKIETWQVEPTNEVPHGVRYSLTLHEPGGRRILGYDNAHAVKRPRKFKFAGQRLTYDHRHRGAVDRGTPYEFKDAYQLLSDFFEEVDRALKQAKGS